MRRHAVLLGVAALATVVASVSFAQATHPVSGRPIAGVMGPEGARWLERPEREAEEAPTKAVAALKLEPGQIVADIGAGSGYYTMLLSGAVGPRGRVYATDVQPEMLALITRKIEEKKVSNVELVLGTATESRLPDAAAGVPAVVAARDEAGGAAGADRISQREPVGADSRGAQDEHPRRAHGARSGRLSF